MESVAMNSSTFDAFTSNASKVLDHHMILLLSPKSCSSYLSQSLFLVLLTCTALQFLRSLHAKTSKPKHKKLPLPPGPSLLTILRNLAVFCQKPQQTLAELAKVHAPDIMRLKLGPTTTIIISSTDIAKEVLQTNDALFADRTVPTIVESLDHHNFSLPFLPVCPLWRDLRRICNDQLFSNKMLDASRGLRRVKLRELLSDMDAFTVTGKPVDVGRAAFKACINFLSNTFVSQDFVKSIVNDSGNDDYKDVVSTLLQLTGRTNVVDIFPVLKILDPQGLQRDTTAYLDKFFQHLDDIIEERKKLRKEDHYVSGNDMLDALLDVAEEDIKKMDKELIKHFLVDLLVAGTDTTAYGLERAMTELLHYPEVMSKAKQELEQVIGAGKPIDETDVPRLPYLQAIVKEALRLYPPAPLLLPRKAKADVEISGYMIPEGSRILINEWAIGRNPNVWENAHLFTPERFLGSKIDVKGRDFQLTPFGSGRRICPGSPLAVRMLQVMLGSLVNTFDWKLENNIKPQDMDVDRPLQAIPVRRNNN